MKNGSWFPEVVHTTFSSAISLNAWAVVAAVTAAGSRMGAPRLVDQPLAVRSAVALMPLVPTFLWIRALSRWVNSLDEMQRRIQLEAWCFAAVGTVCLDVTLNLLQSAAILRHPSVVHGLGWEGHFALTFFLYMLGTVRVNRRFP